MTFLRSLTLGLWLVGTPVVAQNALTGWVVGVADGDTITVLDADKQQHKIRLIGIDAPEKAQAFGDRSKTSLSALVFNKDVRVEWHKRDRYQRIVGKVMVQPPDCATCPMTEDAGLVQVATGMAWWYRNYAREQSVADRERYEQAEFNAQTRRLGLWNDKDPVAPWAWRRR